MLSHFHSTDVLHTRRTDPPAGPDTAPRRSRAAADAARHIVLQRLAPALKHDMVVNLQALAMMAETLSARLERDGPQAGDVPAKVAKLNRLAREAVLKCLNVATWIEQPEEDSVALRAGVEDCVALLSSSFNFRGFSIDNAVDSEFEVPRTALRCLLAASLIMLADGATAPCDLHIHAELDALHATLVVDCTPRGGGDGFRPGVESTAPRIEWADVQALAAAEQVEATRASARVSLRFARAVATPLRMAPI
jgi:hypothetical protein